MRPAASGCAKKQVRWATALRRSNVRVGEAVAAIPVADRDAAVHRLTGRLTAGDVVLVKGSNRALDLPIVEVAMAELEWQLRLPGWALDGRPLLSRLNR